MPESIVKLQLIAGRQHDNKEMVDARRTHEARVENKKMRRKYWRDAQRRHREKVSNNA